MLNIGIHGGSGKMGKMIFECLKNNSQAKVSSIYTIEPLDYEPKCTVTNNFKTFFQNCDVVIDFTIKDGAINLLNYARTDPKPICMGTTGLGEDGENLLKTASNIMPILYATNMSLGIAIVNKLAFMASKALKDFDIEITEMHHRYKKDAPSGTALTLGKSVADARELNLKDVIVTGRNGMIGQRNNNEIAIMSLRGGDIVGKHVVGFYNDGEFVEISHTATSRATFANGAIKAAIWLYNQKNGLYCINDCLGI